MELKIKNQYTYLIYPYVVNNQSYDEYLLKLLQNKNCKIKYWDKNRDLSIYTYFSYEIREKLFWSFGFSDLKKKQLDKLNNKLKSKLLSKYEAVIFEYSLGKNMQGKIAEEGTMMFDINKIEIICFKTGICFIVLKTSLGRESNLAEVLNFNNKFRTIKKDFKTKEDESINIQTDDLNDINDFYSIIKDVIGTNKDAKEMKVLEERIITYSYVCLDENNWNQELTDELKNCFIKQYRVLPNDKDDINDEKFDKEILDLAQFFKVGFSKQGTGIFTSNIKAENSLKVPYLFEQEYFYNYIIDLYKKIFINKIGLEYEENKKFEKEKEKLEEFTENIWTKTMTKDEKGLILNNKWEEILEIQYKFEKLKINMMH